MNTFPFWLIQLGNTKKNDVTNTTRLDDFIKWKYMGHAEFEFGALSKSLIRILHRFNDYKVMSTELSSIDGKRVMVFTRDATIPQKLVHFADRPNPNDYDIKDPSYLENVRSTPAYFEHLRIPSFWWCIDNSTRRHACHDNGDWMALFEDDVPAFLKVMNNEKKVWDELSDDERSEYVKYSNFYE